MTGPSLASRIGWFVLATLTAYTLSLASGFLWLVIELHEPQLSVGYWLSFLGMAGLVIVYSVFLGTAFGWLLPLAIGFFGTRWFEKTKQDRALVSPAVPLMVCGVVGLFQGLLVHNSDSLSIPVGWFLGYQAWIMAAWAFGVGPSLGSMLFGSLTGGLVAGLFYRRIFPAPETTAVLTRQSDGG